jgi:Na+-translocating ferredoxin:NAD+ oxidoreductase RnfG subunit
MSDTINVGLALILIALVGTNLLIFVGSFILNQIKKELKRFNDREEKKKA